MTPRFIPFEAMTTAEQREHLWRMHSLKAPGSRTAREQLHAWKFVALSQWHAQISGRDHTHDKPTRRPR